MSGSIPEPGVEVIQRFTTTSPSIISPTLASVVVGACIQVVDAFDDEGNPQADALAGTYRDSQGVVSYDLPGLSDGALLTGLTDRMRVFLVYGDEVRELNSEDDEIVVDSGTAGVFTLSGLSFVQVGSLWTQLGVEVGDVVRFSYRGETLDLEVTAVVSDSQLTLGAAGPITESSLTGLSFSIVRAAAEFVFSTGSHANFEVGNTTNYLRVSVLSTSTFAGSVGDTLQYEIADSAHYADGADGASGDGIFTSPSGNFVVDIAASSTTKIPTDTHLLVMKASNPPTGAGEVFRQVKRVVSATRLTIETGEGNALSAQAWFLGEQVTSGSNMATTAAVAVTAASASFETKVPGYAGSYPYTPSVTTYIEIATDGLYAVSSVDSSTQLTLATATANTATGRTYRIATLVDSHASDGTTGALTTFVSATGGLSDIPNAGGTPDQPTYISRGQLANENRLVSTVDSDYQVTVAVAHAASFSDSAWQAVDEDADLTLTYDPDVPKISIQLERINGVSSNTYAEISTAITSSLDASYNAAVAAIITSAVTGSGTIVGTDVAYGASPITGNFDGGADASDLLLDSDLLGSSTPTASVYVTYRALRVDVSPDASNPTLLSVSSVDEIETKLGAISVENPLAYGAYCALLNCPSTTVYALGVGAITASKPNGTLEAFTSAFEFLEGYDVYSVAPLTQDPAVHAVLQTHVDAMSESTSKSERIGLFSQALPSYEKAELVASGTDGNTGAAFTSSASAEFSASVDFAAAGVEAGDILVVSATSTSADSPDVANGTVGPLYGIEIASVKPGDDFVLLLDGTATGVSTDWNSLVDVSFSVYRPGAAISQPTDQAEQVALIGEGFADRRMFHVWPDQLTADVQGTEQIVEGHYLAAAVAGKVSQVPPEQGLTNLSVAGFTGVKHSNGYFSRQQLDRMAGGGTFIYVQDSSSAPPRCRHQLATDVSTLQRREMSITKVVDYVAKFLRISLVKHVGRFNITQQYLDALSTIVSGLLRSVVESGRVESAKLVSLAQSETSPDRVEAQVALGVYSPSNYIVVTIEV